MRILCLHVDHIKWKKMKKAIKEPEDYPAEGGSAKEALAVFISVEKRDEKDPKGVVNRLIDEINNIAEQIKVKNIVLYPYVHLTSTPSSPKTALQVLDMAEERLQAFKVYRSPFGWYKAFEFATKGHPLSELSREFGPEEGKKAKEGTEEKFEFEKKKLDKEGKAGLSAAAVVGAAVKELYPKAVVGGIGFYHDQSYVDISGIEIKQDQFPKIEKKVKNMLGKGISFKKAKPDNNFQKEIAKDLGKNSQSYSVGKVVVTPTSKNPFVNKIGAFKLMNLASAYWRGSASNEQLYRIYCVGFSNEKEMQKYLKALEAAEARDHRRIGKDLDLFSFNDITPGSPFFHPKGAIVYNGLINFLRSMYPSWGYEEVVTPLIYDSQLWKTSGHWDHFRENMFEVEMDGKPASFKPMNCPSHIMIFKTKRHSYRDLPRRITDFAPLHRNELRGTLGGLMRVRKFSQDDCHVFCTPEQVKSEIKALIQHCKYVYEKVFGFKFHVELSTKPDKAMGDPKLWKKAEQWLAQALKENKVKYKVNPGDGAFYGPKIDFHIKDALGRSWQCGTEQLDFQQPQRFNVTYEGKDGKKHQAIMLHRTVIGSVERFMGILIEHYGGKFPLWLSPVQVKILTVNDSNAKFAKQVYDKLIQSGIRVELDNRRETIGKKAREAHFERVNYVVTIGDKETKEKKLAVKSRDGKVTFGVELEKLVSKLLKEIQDKS